MAVIVFDVTAMYRNYREVIILWQVSVQRLQKMLV